MADQGQDCTCDNEESEEPVVLGPHHQKGCPAYRPFISPQTQGNTTPLLFVCFNSCREYTGAQQQLKVQQGRLPSQMAPLGVTTAVPKDKDQIQVEKRQRRHNKRSRLDDKTITPESTAEEVQEWLEVSGYKEYTDLFSGLSGKHLLLLTEANFIQLFPAERKAMAMSLSNELASLFALFRLHLHL
eukprot:TRINITY_DN1176_c0_g1_i2.p1 TRINITY_DN1176_c0_g1~~TRINITY_DN1176_c0_g1_i2.p1  ORF type:complete len:186 (-),score=24.93 TRINITY_DN1176_c0_g1_i2:672-1229(-)